MQKERRTEHATPFHGIVVRPTRLAFPLFIFHGDHDGPLPLPLEKLVRDVIPPPT
jgi:hypothetical protein